MSRPEQAVWLIEQLNAKGKLSLTFDYSPLPSAKWQWKKRSPSHYLTGYVVVVDAVRQQNGGIGFLLRNMGGSSRPSPQGFFPRGLPW